MSDSSWFWFSGILSVGSVVFGLSLLGKPASKKAIAPSSVSPVTPSTDRADLSEQVRSLQEQCLRLRHELQQQQTQLQSDLGDRTFEQLQPLLISYPTACKMAQTKPDLPAKNLVALFTPLENWLQTHEIEPIGIPWEAVPYEPHWHQPDTDEMIAGEAVYIRFVGYRQGDRILCPAKVSRTLPGSG